MLKNWILSCGLASAVAVAGLPLPDAVSITPLKITEAKADNGSARRTARRTSRRVNRRHDNYYNALPGGCVRVVVNGIAYHRCGTIYYQPVVRNGTNVYIIVNP
ncbi:conserved hypothetical protein [Roseibium sp. TrichSKD4]|uniref:DUF6515 family protein n=1 Tax=Roseibium sp. TrichSKD4 TaxID=744980 RepID=UPI0001E56180|nr:DUF6515 family protein [Roseibium sp. TrichSKD4]EFO34410.1 conserved hypothetical protein [Roseibium sp. TrichSKD4]